MPPWDRDWHFCGEMKGKGGCHIWRVESEKWQLSSSKYFLEKKIKTRKNQQHSKLIHPLKPQELETCGCYAPECPHISLDGVPNPKSSSNPLFVNKLDGPLMSTPKTSRLPTLVSCQYGWIPMCPNRGTQKWRWCSSWNPINQPKKPLLHDTHPLQDLTS